MWDPPTDEGGAMVTHYIVEKRETSRILWSIVSEKLEECIISVQNLIKGNEYIFRIRGVNKYGVGDPLESEPVIARNSFGKKSNITANFKHVLETRKIYFEFFISVPPGKPTMPTVSMITRSTMTVVWERPHDDGGSDIDGYFLEKREKKSLSWFKVIKNPIRDTRQKVTNLTEGNEYQYRVCAINKAGSGPYSNVSDFYKASDPVGKYCHF